MRKQFWWIIVGVAVVVAVTAGALWLTAGRAPSAEAATLKFLHALESGEAGEITKTGVTLADATLEAFAGASTFVAEATVDQVREDGATATATVSFQLAGNAHTATLHLGMKNDRWLVDAASAVGSVSIAATPGAFVAIDETTFPVTAALSLLPAEYIVTAAPNALLDGGATVQVLPGSRVEATIDAAIRPEATAIAQEQLDIYLSACTEPAAAIPEACGIRIPWGVELATVSAVVFRVEQFPAIELTPTAFTASAGVLVATLTGTDHAGAAHVETYKTSDWSVRGGLTFTAESVELSVW